MIHTLLLPAIAALASASPLPRSAQPTCDAKASANPGPGVEHHETSTEGNYTWPYQVFKSSPLNPPVWEINKTDDASLAPGLIFLTTSGILPQIPTVKMPTAQIFTDEGQLIWAGEVANTTNFKWQYLNGEPTLTYWRGATTSGANVGTGYGHIEFMDTTYNVTISLCPKYDNFNTGGEQIECDSDIHESYITDRNTILVSAYNSTPADLTSVGGPKDGWIRDSQFHELDPYTGEVLFNWSSIAHVPVSDSHLPLNGSGNETAPYDFFHINSVVNIGEYYLVNSRHCWTVYLLDKTGEIIWEFNGNDGGDFGPLPDNGHFAWEHFLRIHNVTDTTIELSMFDNDNYSPYEENFIPTDLLVYTIPWSPVSTFEFNKSAPGQATLKSIVNTTSPVYSESQGSYFPSGSLAGSNNSFADYGQLPFMAEFDPAGKEIWRGRVAPDNLAQIYRAYKLEWHATPYYPPSLAIEAKSSNDTSSEVGYYGYVSWNGATDVTGWNVYVGRSNATSEDLMLVGEVGNRGFETRFEVPCWAEFVQVGAVELGGEGRRSEVVGVN